MLSRIAGLPLVALLAVVPAGAGEPQTEPQTEATSAAAGAPADRLVDGLFEGELRELVAEVLARNPAAAAAGARAAAAEKRAPQVKALPDPMAGVTAFLSSPETRVGPQEVMLAVSQPLPWLGKLDLAEQAAVHGARAARQEVEAVRLGLVGETRAAYWELVFLDRYRAISEQFRQHLTRHEAIARARYSTGVGLGQAVVKLQAEITRVDNVLLEIDAQTATLDARVNALRDRPAGEAVPRAALPEPSPLALDAAALGESARASRPELAAAGARIAAAETRTRLAEKQFRPDFQLGLTYTLVDPRDDVAGRMNPPEREGADILGIQGGVSLPVWRRKLRAGVEEGVEMERSEREARRELEAVIAGEVGDLVRQLDLAWRRLRLLDDLLVVQAEESLESAQAGYIAGTLNALDLLDAEHVLFEARTAVARAQADYLISWARLEGVVARPLSALGAWEQNDE